MLMNGKTVLVSGLLNKYSIATHIASQVVDAGGKVILQIQGGMDHKKLSRVDAAVKDFPEGSVLGRVECDASNPESIRNAISQAKQITPELDGLVHSIGACNTERLVKHGIMYTTLEDFQGALNVSSFSYIAMVQEAERAGMLKDGSSCLALSYLGGEKVVPHYDLMGIAKAALEASNRYLAAALGRRGIRCNILSPGPLKTAAGKGINDFEKIGWHVDSNCFLPNRPTQVDAGKAALFLLSDLSMGITAEVLYCDGGYRQNGMHFNHKTPQEENPS